METKFRVKLETMEDIRDFVYVTNSFPDDIDMVNGRESLNAKSIIAVTYLALGTEVGVHIISNNADTINEFKDAIQKWIV